MAQGAGRHERRSDRAAVGPTIDTLVVDLDESLINWAAGWIGATEALIEALDLRPAARRPFLDHLETSCRRHGSLDAPAALEEAARDFTTVHPFALASAAYAFRVTARAALRPKPGVVRALAQVQAAGTRVIAYTAAPPRAAMSRLAVAQLCRLVDIVVSTGPESPLPADLRLALVVPADPQGCPPVVSAPSREHGPAAQALRIARSLSPSARALVIGHHFAADLAPAQALGSLTVWLADHDAGESEHLLVTEAFQAWPLIGACGRVPPPDEPVARGLTDVVPHVRWARPRRVAIHKRA